MQVTMKNLIAEQLPNISEQHGKNVFQLEVDNTKIYADQSRVPTLGEMIVVVRDGLATIEYYDDQASDCIAGVVVPEPI